MTGLLVGSVAVDARIVPLVGNVALTGQHLGFSRSVSVRRTPFGGIAGTAEQLPAIGDVVA